MKENARKSRLTPEEVRKMLDDFYDEVDSVEKSDGRSHHVEVRASGTVSWKDWICSLFKMTRK